MFRIKQGRVVTSLLLILILLVSLLSACSTAGGCSPAEGKLTILHTNDTHGRTYAEPYISQIAGDLRDNGENVLIFDAGDRLHGQTATNLTQGETMVDIMNTVGYSAMVTGNHEYTFGVERLLELSEMMEFPLLAANVSYHGNNIFQRYTVFEMNGNITVGVFGLVSPETTLSSDPRNMTGLIFENPKHVAAEMVDVLNSKKCDIIIALVHLGNDEATAGENRSDVIASVDGIDLIIDGHSHSTLENGRTVDGTLIVQAGEYAQNIGIVEISIEKGEMTKTARLIPVPGDDEDDATELKADAAVIAKIAEGEARFEMITSALVGYTPFYLNGERETVRTGETNLANLITDSMLHATGADISFIGGGSIRASIEAGDITMGDVLTVLPFANLIVTVELTGNDVLKILEHGVSEFPEPAGLFIQVAGIRFGFDPGAQPGHRVEGVKMADGSDFDADKVYTVATIEFIAAGGDGYDIMKNGTNLRYFGGDAEAFAEYLQINTRITENPEGRILPAK